MGYATSQQLARYYELYQNIDVTFSKEVIKATGLIPQQVFIKAMGGQWPCVINSASLSGAKIISGIKSGFYEKIQQGNTSVSLRFSFLEPEKNEALSFFVTAKITGFTQYAGSPDLVLIAISYKESVSIDREVVASRSSTVFLTSDPDESSLGGSIEVVSHCCMLSACQPLPTTCSSIHRWQPTCLTARHMTRCCRMPRQAAAAAMLPAGVSRHHVRLHSRLCEGVVQL